MTLTDTATLLRPDELADYLTGRGLLPSGEAADVRPLGGGVSNAVFSVRTPRRSLVVKQALPRLRVADRWDADPSRAVREGAALRALHGLTPAEVPECLDLDHERNVVVVPHCPDGWTDWKSRLLAGDTDASVAGRLGGVLATWHRETSADDAGVLGNRVAFHQLRIDPFYRTVMARRPDLADAVDVPLQRMLGTQTCLVHGDFSPKNVLVGADGLWVIDLEVAHVGDPAFDLAFLLSHLMLKSIHVPAARAGTYACAEAFLAQYRRGRAGGSPAFDDVAAHVGCLLLARVVGKSPVEYLDDAQRAQAMLVGERLLAHPSGDLAELWSTLAEVVPG